VQSIGDTTDHSRKCFEGTREWSILTPMLCALRLEAYSVLKLTHSRKVLWFRGINRTFSPMGCVGQEQLCDRITNLPMDMDGVGEEKSRDKHSKTPMGAVGQEQFCDRIINSW
jgi:hypothetical protein